ncbi:hypothetical protein VP277E431_P0168 [Vibrio phage 277E43-1]|nr:hypothetical protein VP277E431_P0168 [Vibrio phage 277E43-1]
MEDQNKRYHILASMAYSHHDKFLEGFDTEQEAIDRVKEMQVNGDLWEVLTIKDNKPHSEIREGHMDTTQLITEILKHKELHNLITHLGDFKEAVESKLGTSKEAIHLDGEEFHANVSYWGRQLKVVNSLIEITRGE